MILKKIISIAISVMLISGTIPIVIHAQDSTIYVAVNGNDSNSGSIDKPLKTLNGARLIARQLKNSGATQINVLFRGGTYYLTDSVVFTADDSMPITYSAYEGENVCISGGIHLNSGNFSQVSDAQVLQLLPREARGKVYQMDLKAQGISYYGEITRTGMDSSGTLSSTLIIDNNEMAELAGWPNHGAYTVIGEVMSNQSGSSHSFRLRDAEKYRLKYWTSAKNPWIYGYFNYDWADDSLSIKSIDTATAIITTNGTSNYGMKVGSTIRMYNMIEELDIPGEYYIDYDMGILYYYPRTSLINTDLQLVATDKNLCVLDGASGITFKNICFEGTRNDAVNIINSSSDNQFINCEFTNIGRKAVTISDGVRNGFVNCHIHDVGKGGIYISCSSDAKKNLTSSENYVSGCLIENYSTIGKKYTEAIGLFGIGDKATGNTIRHAPHCAIRFGGNNNIIEKNDIYNVLMDSIDAGAIYSGRSWIKGGNEIRYNYIHDCNDGIAIYLDDFFTGTKVYGNEIVNMSSGVALQGGSYNTVKNNLFINIKNTAILLGKYWAWSLDEYNTINSRISAALSDADGLTEQEVNDILTNNASIVLEVLNMQNNGFNMEKWYGEFPYLETIITDGNAVTPKCNIVMNNLAYSGDSVNVKFIYSDNQIMPAGIDKAAALASNVYTDNKAPVIDEQNGDYTINDLTLINSVFDTNYSNYMPISQMGCLGSEQMKSFDLIAPVNESSNINAIDAVLCWEEKPDADGYILTIATDGNFENIVREKNIIVPYYRAYDDVGYSFEYGVNYYWKVMAYSKARQYAVKNILSTSTNSFLTGTVIINNVKCLNANGNIIQDFQSNSVSVVEGELENVTSKVMNISLFIKEYDINAEDPVAENKITTSIPAGEKYPFGLGITASQNVSRFVISISDSSGTVFPTYYVNYETLKTTADENQKLAIKAVMLKDSQDNLLLNLKKNEENKLYLSLRNISETEIPASACIAVYSMDNTLLDVKMATKNLQKDEVFSWYTALYVSDIEGIKAKVIIWNQINNQPLYKRFNF